MPSVARKDQDQAGGGIIITGSENVIVNNSPCARVTDLVASHGLPPHSPPPPIVEGSSTVIVNNLKIARLGDRVKCGHPIATGSEDVIAGDEGGGGAAPSVVGQDPPPSRLLQDAGPPGPPVSVDPVYQEAANQRTRSYTSNPDKYRLPPGTDGGGQVKQNYPGTPDDGGAGTSQAPNTQAAASDVCSFIGQVLKEAASGTWRETGQNGNPSNPNIVGIWKTLGYPQSGCWTSDQTAWCMGFVNFVLKSSGYRWVQTARAKDIQDRTSAFGATPVPLDQGQCGDIVLWNYSHVNFIYTASNGKYSFVGGNQSPSKGGNNPNDGDVTNSWPSGWTSAKGGIVGIWRPSKS